MSEQTLRLPEAVFPSGEDSLSPSTHERVVQGLEAAKQRNMVKSDSYRICPETGDLVVADHAVYALARAAFEDHLSNHDLADLIVANSLARYRSASAAKPMAGQVIQLPPNTIPVMLSA